MEFGASGSRFILGFRFKVRFRFQGVRLDTGFRVSGSV